MVEESLQAVPSYRTVEQALLALKKGAHLLKCGRRGKPKFCPFRLSTDEKYLIWYSGQEEKQLRLSSIMKIISGQRTFNFQRQLQPDKVHQSFSLIYANGERSLDLCQRHRPFTGLKSHTGALSCVNSPAGYIRRKHNLGILQDASELSQYDHSPSSMPPKFSHATSDNSWILLSSILKVRSLCGSPTLSLSERCFSDGLSLSSDSFFISESSLQQMQNAVDVLVPNSPYVEPNLKYACSELQKNVP
ncbi:hypothetical protein GH714_033465 [Hevea brasiliensis]|uniref:PH domain-containing protein n=1 Tax=Hevea brasiliensis TaxID=3981 RepID=A0A6A6MP16_HEVBR|nr:hypothetical protein GH714_033465 [Hevea brasiliensis]